MISTRWSRDVARIIITMPDDLLISVDAHARRSRKSRSALVRSAVAEWVAAREREEFEALLAEGYKEQAAVLAQFAEDFACAQSEALQATWRWDD